VLLFIKKYRVAVAAVIITALLAAGGLGFYLYDHYYSHSQPPALAVVNTSKTPAASPVSNYTTPNIRLAGSNNNMTPVTPGPMPGVTAATTATDSIYLTRQLPDSVNNELVADAGAPAKVEWNTLTVPPRTDYRLELADGTEVHLNASSTLRFPFIFLGKTREVYLDGEAYFIVAKNSSQPFIVHTPSTSVKALGTAFNINSYNADLVVTSLVQGAAVTDVGDSLDVTLKPGYEAIYRTGERFKVKRFDESITLSWREGIYRFRNTRLADLQPVIQRWFGLKLAFEPQSIAGAEYSGCLEKNKPLSGFLDQLANVLRLDYRIYDNTIHFNTRK
jgi:transmembrane sensor